MFDPQQRYQIGVTAGLRDHARAGIHQDDRQIRRGTTRDHIPGVLLVPRGVGDDELTVVRAEIAVSHIDRDTLLTLGLQAIQQQSVVDMLAGVAHTLAVTLQGIQLILVYFLTIKQQSAYQVDLPSSTEPAVKNLSRSFCSSLSRNSFIFNFVSAMSLLC